MHSTLRADNNDLFKEISLNDEVLCLAAYSQVHVDIMSNMRKQFLSEALYDLSINLEGRGLYLVSKVGDVYQEIKSLVELRKIESIRFPKKFSYDENQVFEKLKEYCSNNIGLKVINTKTIIKNCSIENLPSSFTSFRKQVEKKNCYNVTKPYILLNKYNSIINSHELCSFEFKSSTLRYSPKRRDALENLNKYIWKKELIKTYKQIRNGLLGENYSTKFSVYLSLGILSVDEIVVNSN